MIRKFTELEDSCFHLDSGKKKGGGGIYIDVRDDTVLIRFSQYVSIFRPILKSHLCYLNRI
jgi:hypothetical protein